MVVIVLEKVPVGVRGELTRWMLELRAGVFVGKLSAMVRERLWAKVCDNMRAGGGILLYAADTEQGFVTEVCGATSRSIRDFEGLLLAEVPGA